MSHQVVDKYSNPANLVPHWKVNLFEMKLIEFFFVKLFFIQDISR